MHQLHFYTRNRKSLYTSNHTDLFCHRQCRLHCKRKKPTTFLVTQRYNNSPLVGMFQRRYTVSSIVLHRDYRLCLRSSVQQRTLCFQMPLMSDICNNWGSRRNPLNWFLLLCVRGFPPPPLLLLHVNCSWLLDAISCTSSHFKKIYTFSGGERRCDSI